MSATACRLIIHGRVQGVWFRDWTVKVARELNLRGWARNRRDGTVEVQVEGDTDAIERYITVAHDGPPAADVTSIERHDAASEENEGFTKRPTI